MRASGFAALATGLALPIVVGAATLFGPGWLSLTVAAALGLATSWAAHRVRNATLASAHRQLATLLALAAYLHIVRLLFAGSVDLMPEEAYYWNYSRRLALGYLDHPPLISWLIALGTKLLGDRELGVRLGALLCGLATTALVYATTLRAHGRRTAWIAAALAPTLPYVFASGLVATPDAPLLVGWAGTVLFARRALFHGEPRAWLGAGAFLGLGLLSKYTIVLLALGIVAFVLFDRDARAELRRPHVYAGALLALAVFSPVIAWNASNGWASFAFQSGRTGEPFEGVFVHELAAGALLMAGPLLFTALRPLLALRSVEGSARRLRTFLLWTTLLPLAVFLQHSLRHSVRLHWSGPIWVVWLPSLAAALDELRAESFALRWRAWLASGTVVALLVAWTLADLALGIQPLSRSTKMRMPFAWSELAEVVGAAEDEFELRTGRDVIMVGMDKNFLASEVAFYVDGAREWEHVTSRHLFGRSALMFARWTDPRDLKGADLLLVAFSEEELDAPRVRLAARALGPIRHRVIERAGTVFGQIWLRELRGYRPPELAASAAAPDG